jgi:2-oxo-4-hydroxy-4-carboxy-5-ureidoimidazoline decarboxylase
MAALSELNVWPADKAREELLRCCGCAKWAEDVAARRPFAGKKDLLATAAAVWAAMGETQWREAFAQHPRIGGKDALRAQFAATLGWAQGEQAGTVGVGEDVLDALAKGNAEYEARFGHIFIVCATGKSASEILDLLTSRLENSPAEELRVAAAEQAKIMNIRLEKLIP